MKTIQQRTFYLMLATSLFFLSLHLYAQGLGDVNADNQVTIVDALMTAQYSVGLNPTPFNTSRADFNQDGQITIVDALMIAQLYVGLITPPPTLTPTRTLTRTPTQAAEQLAFAGAVGFGRLAKGGRGGDVYQVTNLNDTGAGSLRYGIQNASGARTIVFTVAGNIILGSPLTINKPNITIAGQTAPGDGITIATYPLFISGTHDVVVRWLRSRCGDFNAAAGNGKPAKGNGDLTPANAGALDIGNGSSQIIVDHLSCSWSMDEVLSVTECNYVTVQNCIISESLNNSNHEKGAHGFGSLIRGNGTGGYTFYRNLYAHNDGRNPGPGSNETDVSIKLELDFVNNVVYGWGNRSGEAVGGSSGGIVELNYMGNYVIANSSARNPASVWDEEKTMGILTYQTGNMLDNNFNTTRDGTDGGWAMFPNFTASQQRTSRYAYPAVPVLSALAAYNQVMASCGASLKRDAVDTRVINQVKNNTGGIIDSQTQVGGLPALNTAAAPADADKDGMADAWEAQNGLSGSNAADRNGYNLDPNYTNLEVYLNSLVPLE